MRIALLEDDKDYADFISALLTRESHSVHAFDNGRDLLNALGRDSFDLLILDWQVPDLSGYQVLRAMRTRFGYATPALFVTQRDAEEDIVQALEAGANDYLVKPVRPRELVARVNALLRGAVADSAPLEFPPYRIDPQLREVTLNGEKAVLTQKEFELALFLFRNSEKVVSRAHILEAVWGLDSATGERAVDTHLSRLRGRLALNAANGWRLVSVYGYGYRLERQGEAERS